MLRPLMYCLDNVRILSFIKLVVRISPSDPLQAAVQLGGARGVMMAYNEFDDIPAHVDACTI